MRRQWGVSRNKLSANDAASAPGKGRVLVAMRLWLKDLSGGTPKSHTRDGYAPQKFRTRRQLRTSLQNGIHAETFWGAHASRVQRSASLPNACDEVQALLRKQADSTRYAAQRIYRRLAQRLHKFRKRMLSKASEADTFADFRVLHSCFRWRLKNNVRSPLAE